MPMKDLARILEGLGYTDVRTYIQSGNVVMSGGHELGEDAAGAISDAVEKKFSFRPAVLILEKSELMEAVERNPFPTEVGKHLHFTFLEQAPQEPDLETLEGLLSESERFRLDGRVFYFYAPDGIGRSKAVEKIERCLGVQGTARNFNTISKLMEMI